MRLAPFLGLAFAVAGADKLAGDQNYDRMYKHLGWSRQAMQIEAAAEVAGGLMLLRPKTRRLGGAVLTAASVAMLVSELQDGDGELALPRAGLLLGAFLTLLRG